MSVKIFEIKCTKCNQGIFKGEPETCTYCGTQITDDLIEADLKQRSKELREGIKTTPVYEIK